MFFFIWISSTPSWKRGAAVYAVGEAGGGAGGTDEAAHQDGQRPGDVRGSGRLAIIYCEGALWTMNCYTLMLFFYCWIYWIYLLVIIVKKTDFIYVLLSTPKHTPPTHTPHHTYTHPTPHLHTPHTTQHHTQ